jgi:small GTP-binding protein
MTDKEILKRIETKLNVKFGNYKDWREKGKLEREKRKKESKDSPNKNIRFSTENTLQEKQLAAFDKKGNIIELYLNGLSLNEIPKEVYELKNLIRFDFVHNNLKVIPIEISEFPKLKILYLFHNNIETIPDEVLFMKTLIQLDINNNPLKDIPIEVIEIRTKKDSLTSIRDYVNSLKQGTKDLNEVKVILVGDGGAGKTSLQKLLIKEKFNPQECQTHGINIRHLTLRPNNRNVKFRLWDFGGQEIMHATHQFFLSRRSIYIIMLNAREEPNPEYWLNHINSFGGSSPVLIVINKTDENPSYDVNRLFLKEKYPNIIEFIKISCAQNKGIEIVKTELRNAVSNIENLNVKWPLSWFKVKTHLEKMSSNFINHDEFHDLCIKNGVHDLSSQNTLVEYLNDLGIILHFKEFSLSDTHVLDPEWVTFAVYKILNSNKLASNKGVLKLTEIRTILKSKEENGRFKYPSNQLNYIIELMMKFELCYRISNSEILVPDLLAVQEPDLNFGEQEKLNVIISYSFLPKSIMPRLIVNLHNDIIDKLRWRTGLAIYDDTLKTSAILKADYESKEISITVFGSKKRDYLSIILFILRKINGSFKGLEQKVNIPVVGAENIKISHSHLLTLESKGITKYIPDGLDYDIDVRKMLGSIQGTHSTEEEIFVILDKLVKKSDSPGSIAEKANEIIQLQPNFFGLGINLNALVKKYLKKK